MLWILFTCHFLHDPLLIVVSQRPEISEWVWHTRKTQNAKIKKIITLFFKFYYTFCVRWAFLPESFEDINIHWSWIHFSHLWMGLKWYWGKSGRALVVISARGKYWPPDLHRLHIVKFVQIYRDYTLCDFVKFDEQVDQTVPISKSSNLEVLEWEICFSGVLKLWNSFKFFLASL